MSETEKLIKEINENLKQVSGSKRDRRAVTQSILNDPDYKVGVYEKGKGKVGEYCPHEDFVQMNATMISATTKVKAEEALAMANGYTASLKVADQFNRIADQTMMSYLETGRKLTMEGREEYHLAFYMKDVPAGIKKYPSTVGKTADGKAEYATISKEVPAHKSVRSYGSCPDWKKA